jgi:DNA polymerase IV
VRDAPTILHADLDAFYASVEQLLDPTLCGKPIAVGGGVVLAASYEARVFGVRGGMSGFAAKKLCPTLQFVGGSFSRYQEFGDRVVEVFNSFTPLVERVSIDEAFLDVAGAERLFGSPRAIAEAIRTRVRKEIGLPVSVGAATTKHLAKVASQVAKPDGLVVVAAGTEREFLDPLPVDLLWGVGPKTQERLRSQGIVRIGQLAAADPDRLAHLLGNAHSGQLQARASNRDNRGVRTHRRAGSVGAQSACGRQAPTPEMLRATLGHLADRVARRLRKAGRAGRTVTVRVRFADLRAITRSVTLAAPIDATLTLTETAEELVRGALADNPSERVVTLLAISVSGLLDPDVEQLQLPFDSPVSERSEVDRAMDRVRSKFGAAAVGFAATSLSNHRSVPDAFRELAEHDL